jgi:subtilisin family serine protease
MFTMRVHVSRFTFHVRLVLLSILATALLLPTSGGAAPAEQQAPGLALLGAPVVTTGSDGAMQRVAPDLLREAREAQPGDKVGVIVVSQGPLADLSSMGSPAPARPDGNGLTFTSGRVLPGELSRVAAAPNVIAVLSNTAPPIPPLPEPAYARPAGPRPFPGVGSQKLKSDRQKAADSALNSQLATRNSQLTPDSWHTLDVHHVRDAWAQGFQGKGVKVAVLDSGVDFGHPDLQGTFARVDDPASPYFGWPYVVDPYSICSRWA